MKGMKDFLRGTTDSTSKEVLSTLRSLEKPTLYANASASRREALVCGVKDRT